MEKKINTIDLIIEIIKLKKSSMYYLFAIFFSASIIILATKIGLKIPITLVISYAIFTSMVSPYLIKYIKKENRDKYRYIVYIIMMSIIILFFIKDYIERN